MGIVSFSFPRHVLRGETLDISFFYPFLWPHLFSFSSPLVCHNGRKEVVARKAREATSSFLSRQAWRKGQLSLVRRRLWPIELDVGNILSRFSEDSSDWPLAPPHWRVILPEGHQRGTTLPSETKWMFANTGRWGGGAGILKMLNNYFPLRLNQTL